MTDPARDAASVIDLLTRYSFDLSGYTVDRLTEYWLQNYPSDWIRLAVVEALYQGRYKAVSIEQILNLWRRRGKPLHHFSPDFERIIAPRTPKSRTAQSEVIVFPPPYVPPALKLELNTLELDLLELDTLELELPQPFAMPRPMGAIQPFSVSGLLLPKDAMFQRFYAQLLAPGELQQLTEPEPIEADSCENLEEIAPFRPDSEPKFFPGQPIAEFKAEFKAELKSVANPAITGLPIQPFKPSGEEMVVGSLEISPQTKDLGSPPIHQFVPTLAPSEFYAKLKAIVQNATTSRLAKNSEPIEPPEP
jgi:hypothetical protein